MQLVGWDVLYADAKTVLSTVIIVFPSLYSTLCAIFFTLVSKQFSRLVSL